MKIFKNIFILMFISLCLLSTSCTFTYFAMDDVKLIRMSTMKVDMTTEFDLLGNLKRMDIVSSQQYKDMAELVKAHKKSIWGYMFGAVQSVASLVIPVIL